MRRNDLFCYMLESKAFNVREKTMISTVLLILAFVFFVLAALPMATKLPFSLVPAGLACWVLSQIIAMGIIQ